MTDAAPAITVQPPHAYFDFNDAVDLMPDLAPIRHHDKDDLRARLLDQLEVVLVYLFPHGKRQGSHFVVGNLQGDPGDSLVIELEGAKRGIWIDFATGESGDVLALWAAVRGFILPRDFGDLLNDVGDWLAVPRFVAASNNKPGVAHDDLGQHSGKWDNLSADGELLACVYRYDTPNGKQYTGLGMSGRVPCECQNCDRCTTCPPSTRPMRWCWSRVKNAPTP